MKVAFAFAAAVVAAVALPAQAQMRTDPAVIAEQKEAMAKLAKLHGEWRGSATLISREGTRKLVQTERVGPMLDGTLLVIEGRGYEEDGKLSFNAFATISYDAAADQYAFNSWSDGRYGKFPLTVTADGFEWSIPMPNGATIAYRATVADGKWSETGTFKGGDGMPSFDFVKLSVDRIGDSAWPAAGFLPPKP